MWAISKLYISNSFQHSRDLNFKGFKNYVANSLCGEMETLKNSICGALINNIGVQQAHHEQFQSYFLLSCRCNLKLERYQYVFLFLFYFLKVYFCLFFSSLMIQSSSFTLLHVNSWSKYLHSPGSTNHFIFKNCQPQPGLCVENSAQDILLKNLWFCVVGSSSHLRTTFSGCACLSLLTPRFLQNNVFVNKKEQRHRRWVQWGMYHSY